MGRVHGQDPLELFLSVECEQNEPLSNTEGYDVDFTEGFQPDDGEYIIDPDYMDMMGTDNFYDMIKYHK